MNYNEIKGMIKLLNKPFIVKSKEINYNLLEVVMENRTALTKVLEHIQKEERNDNITIDFTKEELKYYVHVFKKIKSEYILSGFINDCLDGLIDIFNEVIE